MNIMEIPCNPVNYGGIRGNRVEYIVVHYTAGRNDTAENNGKYFAREQVGVSAHFFVDENRVVRSVPEDRVAYHCGGNYYYHPDCRNGNSIGVEICTKYVAGTYAFDPAAVENAKILIRDLMQQYNVPVERVIRHFDVTHKVCPAPFCGTGEAAWREFKEGLKMYQKIENVPDWAKPTVQKLVDKDVLVGDGKGNLDLSHEMTRMLVILDRAGVFG